jgi:hypothetical protein
MRRETRPRMGRRLRSAPLFVYPPDMSDLSDLYVEFHGAEITITFPGTRYTVTYYKPANSAQFLAKNFPYKSDDHCPMSNAEFLAYAWRLANEKARELGWIV